MFRYSQTALISITIQLVGDTGAKEGDAVVNGYWLVYLDLFIYIGLAVSRAIYVHQLNRLKVMIRGTLVGLIYHRSLHVQGGKHNDGNALTLMNTDVDSLDSIGETFHKTWAQFVEVVVGIALLVRQIGWLCPVPLSALNATQKRLTVITSMLNSAKSIKMLGVTGVMKSNICDLRDQEIETSKELCWIMVAYNASANALGTFAPVLTLVLFAIVTKSKDGNSLDPSTAFTSVALFSMVTHLANMVTTMVPRAVASMANFERI
ncbi:hypothetical protein DL95DRAFT_465471 [Leptodontidium sp. 2 PMI_412]|nr:hypothetical protein DL95DRAFT_465471 [Leptodontidium sp. 2 PMI_412]